MKNQPRSLRRDSQYATQSERDFNLLVEQSRKSFAVYGRLARQSVTDLVDLYRIRELPFQDERYMYEGIRGVSDYCYQQRINNIVLIDKSARPLWAGISQYWDLAYSGNQKPRIQFINPSLFRRTVKNSKTPSDLSAALHEAANELVAQLQSSRSPLLVDRDHPLLLVDSCMHSGKSVYLTKRVMGIAGFSDVRAGVINTTLVPDSEITPEVIATDSILATRCFRPSAEETLVKDAEYSIYSEPIGTSNPDIYKRAADLRASIRLLVQNGFDS